MIGARGCGVSVLAIDDKSEHLETVKTLWRANSGTLGFLPEGAFTEYASRRHILVALGPGEDCVGYLLYRIARGRATIVHLCIADAARGQGHATALVEHLVAATGHLRGISLRCRRDFPAYGFWPRVGFHALDEMPGRAADGSQLTLFWLDHNHPNLFTQEATAALDAVIDLNVFIDLDESRNEESQGLVADWLQDSIRLCITVEHSNEFDRSRDRALREKRRRKAADFHRLDSSPAEYRRAEQLVAPLIPDAATPQDQSDIRHLARALAGGAWAFVTRDQPMLDRADRVYAACGLPVVRPAELICRIDELLREPEYQRFQVAGTRRLVRQRASSAGDDVVEAIKAPGESKPRLRADLQQFLADPQRFACVTVRDAGGEVLAFYVVERQGQFDRVCLFRMPSHRLAGTLARSILTGLAYQAARDRRPGVLLAEPGLTSELGTACADLGFLPFQAGHLKVVVRGVHPAAGLADMLEGLRLEEPAFKLVADVLRSPLNATRASEIEHLLWPAKIADADLPSFLVPIRPEFAQHLFDEYLAKQTLFGADVDLALNPESVYYRSAYQRILDTPGRILWYVSKNPKFRGTMKIRACSRIVEVCVGKPKPLFKRFQRLGVYEWRDVLHTAKGEFERDIMAVRFHDTEPLPSVDWDTFQGILRGYGIRTNLESPARISSTVFNEIYALALDSPAIR